MEQKIQQPLLVVSGMPRLGRVPSSPVYLPIMFCLKQHFPPGCPVTRCLGDVDEAQVRDQMHLKKGCKLNPLLKYPIAKALFCYQNQFNFIVI